MSGERRRVMILAYFYPPLAGGGVHRVLSFTRHLPAHGWDCTVVCAGPDDSWIRDPSLLDRVPAGTEVLRVGGGSGLALLQRLRGARTSATRSSTTIGWLRRAVDWFAFPDSYAGWAARARAVAARRLARGDISVLLSSSPPDSSHLAARSLARRFGLPWVADFRDPWVGLHFRTPPTPWHRARHRAAERAVVAEAAVVLAASHTHERELQALRGRDGRPLARSVVWLPNGYEPANAAASADAESPPRSRDGGAPTASTESRFLLVFTGTLALMDSTFTALEALARFVRARPAARSQLQMVLAGPYESSYAQRVAALGLADLVRLTGSLAHDQARALQRKADVLLLWKPLGVGYRTMVPGKLYEYLDAGRPILALLPSDDEAARMVLDAGGTVVPPGDAAAVERALEAAFGSWLQGGRVPERRPAWLTGHARERLAAELAGTLETIVKGRR
ncbi:MAG: glycosyltransferase [Candidatus Eisenbacteria bacterium]|uniref:Glycosyltransferase n=1 Tax=Eiseniibacteriota bacterium TaxID=2212470 RepID=A0A849SIJ0_UNCEI|nr:glycosyltransferase [Candidatus Eisenbacteria bacterium]